MLPLEDAYNDILGKAHRGLKIAPETLAEKIGVPLPKYQSVLEGEFDEDIVCKAAPHLGLDAERLSALGKKEYHPNLSAVPATLATATTDFDGGTVNAYVVWDPASKEAAIFDTGMDATPLLQIVEKNGLSPKYVLITHSHMDHIIDLPRLAKAFRAPVFAHESVDGSKTFEWGGTFSLGGLHIETRQTTGHAADGTTFIISGLETPVAIVGDAIFAGSMGGGIISYEEALHTNRKNILTLADDTILCPGHGPLTTVAKEKANNPFFPA